MIVRHTETKLHEPSVRFYRTIAFSFLIVTVILLGVVIFVTSKKATITVIAKEDSKNVNLNINLDGAGGEGKLKGFVTTTLVMHAEKYFPTGAKSLTGVAEGEVIIYNKSGTDQVLVKTTQLLTPAGVLFRLSDRVTIPAHGETVARVYADQAGVTSEIEPSLFTVVRLNPERQKVIYAESKTKMIGGTRVVGILSEDDWENAKKDYGEKVKKAAVEAAIDHQWSNLNKIAVVVSQNIQADKKIGEEVDSFTLSGDNAIVLIGYDRAELVNLVNRELSQKINVGFERVLSNDGEPTVTVVSYDLNNKSAQLSVKQEVSVSLDPDAEMLLPGSFLGRSKDEIQRYVMGLDHVAGIDVVFSPSWMRKSPAVPDKIKVIVKSVK